MRYKIGMPAISWYNMEERIQWFIENRFWNAITYNKLTHTILGSMGGLRGH